MSPAQWTEDIKTNHVLIYSEFHILEKRPLSLVNEPDLGYDVIKISSFRAGNFGRTSRPISNQHHNLDLRNVRL